MFVIVLQLSDERAAEHYVQLLGVPHGWNVDHKITSVTGRVDERELSQAFLRLKLTRAQPGPLRGLHYTTIRKLVEAAVVESSAVIREIKLIPSERNPTIFDVPSFED